MNNVLKMSEHGSDVRKVSESELVFFSKNPTVQVVKKGIWHIKDSGAAKTIDYKVCDHNLGFKPAFMMIHLFDEMTVEVPDPEIVTDNKVYKPYDFSDCMGFQVDEKSLYFKFTSGDNMTNWEKKFYYYILNIPLEEDVEYNLGKVTYNPPKNTRGKNVLKVRGRTDIKTAQEKDLNYSSTIKPLLVSAVKSQDLNPGLDFGSSQDFSIPNNLGYTPLFSSFQRLYGSERISLLPYYLTTYVAVSDIDFHIHVDTQFGGETANVDKIYVVSYLEALDE